MNTSPGIDTLRTVGLTLQDASPGLIRRIMVVIPTCDLPALSSREALEETIKQIAGEYSLDAAVAFRDRSVTVRLSRTDSPREPRQPAGVDRVAPPSCVEAARGVVGAVAAEAHGPERANRCGPRGLLAALRGPCDLEGG